jgi:hypothetical protein
MAENILDDYLFQEFSDNRYQRLRNYTIGVGILCLLGWIGMRITIIDLELCSWSEGKNSYDFIEENLSVYTGVGALYFGSYVFILYGILTNGIKELNGIRVFTAFKEFFGEAKNNSRFANVLLFLLIMFVLILAGLSVVALSAFLGEVGAGIFTYIFHLFFLTNEAPFIIQDTTFILTLCSVNYLMYYFLKGTNTFKNYGKDL